MKHHKIQVVRKIAQLVISLLFLSLLHPSTASAEAKWTSFSNNDYIFGYTSLKYSCWSGVANDNLPVLEIYSQNSWIKVATGQILPQGSDIQSPCKSEFPIAVGFQWIVMNPSPPAYATNRYQALYRTRIPDTEYRYQEPVIKQVLELQEKCCVEKITSKKVPYIAKVKKNGKTQNVIKYRTRSVSTQVTYMEEVLVDVYEYEEKVEITPGFVSTPANIAIYPSLASMNDYVADVGSSILCSFGFTEKCKK